MKIQKQSLIINFLSWIVWFDVKEFEKNYINSVLYLEGGAIMS